MKSSPPQEDAQAAYVHSMFSSIARRYDLMNRLMTAGQDRAWRREVVRLTKLPAHGHALDLGTGTGDLALEVSKQVPTAHTIAADFTLEMMQAGRVQQNKRNLPLLNWCAADALHLPYPDGSFDAVMSGFLMRNVSDLDLALREQYRILKPDSRIVILDTTRPPQSFLTPFINLHLSFIIPTLGKLITGNREAYTYLPTSTRKFLTAEALAARMLENGFREVAFHRLMFDTIAIHWGVK